MAAQLSASNILGLADKQAAAHYTVNMTTATLQSRGFSRRLNYQADPKDLYMPDINGQNILSLLNYNSNLVVDNILFKANCVNCNVNIANLSNYRIYL